MENLMFCTVFCDVILSRDVASSNRNTLQMIVPAQAFVRIVRQFNPFAANRIHSPTIAKAAGVDELARTVGRRQATAIRCGNVGQEV
eukprot:m.241494 g.241494  ORF g.241494 m.241494 type:complete len:87 (+) comp53073_c0_seq1:181-441(+)